MKHRTSNHQHPISKAARVGTLDVRCWMLFVGCFLFSLFASAQETGRLYLSGHDKDDAVPWDFQCTSGANSGFWTNLPVPSQWDMHGFGTLSYHKDATNAWNERGLYAKNFFAPKKWSGERIFLVFEGAMTDTSAKLNGQSAGPTHQGGFYRFKYEVTSLVKFGATNRLEVDVARHSANKSVNDAERLADFWVFGGIYRPVYLEIVPQQFIERVAIDAKADGNFSANVFLNGVTNADEIEAQIQTLDGKNVGKSFQTKISDDRDFSLLTSHFSLPKLWTAETPNLYVAKFRLKQNGKIIHEFTQRFGFRTFEVRDGDGLYLNGRRVILKGADRHSFWPDSGRCLSEKVHRLDIETMKDMNMNAVRMSHYPPDQQFLDLCDELGLYVLDELAGWHHFYDNNVGPKLVHEMVVRDVNHPSILFWDNGNEGGFNTNLDHIFPELDPQHRRVLHPWAAFSGVNTAHYLDYDQAKIACDGVPIYYHPNGKVFADTNDTAKYIYMPTEFQHGLFDGGAGAGLEDYWRLMSASKYLGGGFIWVLEDDAVKRPDTGEMDTAGNQAPDGIVGPYRQREGSFYAIKEIWSPIQILETRFELSGKATSPKMKNCELTVKNNFNFINTRQCKFSWELRRYIFPESAITNQEIISTSGKINSPNIPPGAQGKLILNLPENFWHTSDVTEGDFLAVRANDPNGRELWTRVWPLRSREILSRDVGIVGHTENFGDTNSGAKELKRNDFIARVDEASGLLKEVERAGKKFSFTNGPRLATTNCTLKEVFWRLREDGWLQCDYTYTATGTNDYFGVLFDYPENLVKHKRWLGDGPYRVWKNRLRGVMPGVWENDYNNTITGWRDWIYPEFKGCFSNVRWLQLDTTEGQITVVNNSGVPFMQVLTPEFPPAKIAGHTIPPLPKCGLGFLDAIPPIGSKFKEATKTGPQGQPNVGRGEYSGSVSFYFGKLP
jgi:hypothetical protein